jgi:23S rRNA pseudouridine2605 synthase
MEERLQKILARGGVASRRASELLMLDGRVSVNGKIVVELGSRADPAVDTIAVDGKPLLRATKHSYIMLNKPPDYVTTRHDPEGRPTVYDLVPDLPGLFTVGRLDRETEGLLLLTTDGDWSERIAHPRYQIEREYEVRIVGPLSPAALERLREGAMLDDRFTRPVAVYQSGQNGQSAIITMVIVEGRKREVRMLCASAGLKVKRLIRRRIDSLLLGWLAEGHWRNLDASEVASLGGADRRSRTGTNGRRQRLESRFGAEGEIQAGDSEGLHSNRRASSVRQVDNWQKRRAGAEVPVPGHGRDVPGSYQRGSGAGHESGG